MASNKPIKYNPAFLTQDELIKSFVVRNMDFELVMELIRENRGPTNQHLLIVGPRGSGKTTLALRVAAELRKDKDFSNLWYPIVFSEESYEVCSPGEFWLEALFHIGKHTQDHRWKRIHKELRSEKDESRLRDRSLAQVMDFADEQGKRLLFIVENLNMLLGQQIGPDAAWEIRHTLINEPRLMLLGTAISRFEQLENSDKAMFELFKIHELEPLSSDECRILWRSITGQEIKGDRIRPIQILTGGSPRLLVIISVFAARASFRELMEDLTHLVDEHTEYFKSHIDNLPTLERKVFVTLADLWQPSTARELAEAARIDVNKASAYLKRLVSKGAVMEVEQDGGRKWYQLAERMYNIYHLMRRRGEPSSRVRAVVDFMVHFYAEEDLVKTISSIAEEACAIDPQSRSDHYQALIEILKSPQIQKYREEIIDKIPHKLFDAPDLPEPLRKMSGLYATPPVKSISLTEEELQSVRPNNADDPNAWIELGAVLEKETERLEDAEHAYREAIRIDPENIRALGSLTVLLVQTGRSEEAVEVFRELLDLKSDLFWIWALYGYLLQYSLKHYEEAEKAFRRALEINPDYASLWNNLGELYAVHLNRYEEAETAYRKAIEINPDYAPIWLDLGILLATGFKRYEEAEQAFRKAIEIDPDYASAWYSMGKLFSEYLNRYEEAEEAYRKAIEIDPKYAFAWSKLGLLLFFKLKRYDVAENAFRKAIESDPDFVLAWVGLGSLMDYLERYEEAEMAYKKALEISPAKSLVLESLCDLYRRMGRYGESEQAYHKALEIEPNNAERWLELISLQMDNIRSPEKALQSAQKAVEAADRSPEMLNAIAQAFYQNEWNDYLDKAEEWGLEAIEKDPDNPAYRLTLASILGEMKRWEEALEISPLFLKTKEFISENINSVTSFFINAAASGYSAESLEILEQSDIQKIMEPLIAGLKIFLGKKVRAPQEVMEIGKDVSKRIKERMEAQTVKSIRDGNS
jgi:tetratricopeptide (TPR) repeat protein